MSPLRSKLADILRAFDEAAFIALGNRGLLRRAHKDLERSPAAILEESPAELVVAIAEFRIRFDARGPAHARCDCPASGVCQHILAASLALPPLLSQGGTASVDAGSRDDAADRERLRAELLDIGVPELIKHAGKAGYRWAWQFIHDLEGEDAIQLGGTRSLSIAFSRPPVSFRYAGGGLASLVAESDRPRIEKYRVAAVLAFRRAHGCEIAPPPEAGPTTASLDLGKDHAAVGGASSSIEALRTNVRDATRRLLTECLQLGLSHLSPGMQERFATLAVAAQAAEYPRLALLLRRLSDHVEQLVDRAGGADEHRLLDECTLAYGLIEALERSSRAGLTPAALVGRARSRYEDQRSLELLGLGARPWRSPSGFVGLTMLFWSPKTAEFLSSTDARPESQRSFDPVARYRSAGPWSGLGAPAMTTGRLLQLLAPQVSAAGRISGTEATSATLGEKLNAAQFRASLRIDSDWSAIASRRGVARRSLLSEPTPMDDWCVLLPTRSGAAQFDSTRQTLTWPLFDAAERCITLEVPYSELSEAAIRRIEALDTPRLPTGTLVIARLFGSPSGLCAEPLSLVRPASDDDGNPIDSLYFDPPPKQGIASRVLASLRRRSAEQAIDASTFESSHQLPTALRELRTALERRAEQGCARDAVASLLQQTDALVAQAERAGFPAFSRIRAMDGATGSPEHLLRLHYLCMQHERLITEADEVDTLN